MVVQLNPAQPSLRKGGIIQAEPTIVSTVTTALQSVAADMTSTLTTILPIALALVGGVMVVVFGIKLFKKLTGRA